MLIKKRIKDLFLLKAGGDLNNMTVEQYQDNKHQYPIYANSAFNEGIYGYTNNYQFSTEALTVTARGNLGISFYRNRPFAAIGRLLILQPKRKGINLKYVDYILKFNTSVGNQTAIPQLTSPELGNKIITIFNSEEQQTAIANYLDHHTGKIDKEINLLEQKVEKLDEYKQALIYETVTKGLDKNVAMKDSGIEWIGMIPEHWEKTKIRSFVKESVIKFKHLKNAEMIPLSLGGGKIYPRNLEENALSDAAENYKLVQRDNLVIGIRAWQNSISVSDLYGFVSPAYKVYKLKNNKIVPKYLKYYVNNIKIVNHYITISQGICSDQWKVDDQKFRNLDFFMPSLTEQNFISNFLDEQCAKIDRKKELINKKIDLLKEYKQSVIYEVVTGKITIGE